MRPILSAIPRVAIALGLLAVGLTSAAQGERYVDLSVDPELIEERIQADEDNLVPCYVSSCGLKFQCNPNWKMKVVDENSTIITISSEPYVTLAISRIDSDIKYLGQLSQDFFKEKNLYSDNFQKEYSDFAGTQAIELKAFSLLEPDMRYLGYFYLNRERLYSVLFAVYPKDSWGQYQYLIQKISQSFERI